MLNAYNGKTDICLAYFSEYEIPYDYRNEQQQRQMIYDQFKDTGWRTPEYINSAISQNNMNWLNLTDIDGINGTDGAVSTVAKAYGIEPGMLPMAYLIGPDGKILARRLKLSDQELSLSIEKLLK